MTYAPGVKSRFGETDRLNVHYLEAGTPGGEPVVFVHGNLSTGRFFEQVMSAGPSGYHFLAPDMRGFGDTERVPIDATRGLKDWADDVLSLLDHLEIEQPAHFVGWSTGGAAIAELAILSPSRVASLTFIDPASPFGFGGTKDVAGTPVNEDFSGTGGGGGNPDFVRLLAEGDTSTDSDLSPLNVLRSSYWSANHTVDAEWERLLLEDVLKSELGEDGYPGDMTESAHWPGFGPGTRGILNALSGKHCNWSGIVDVDPKPPILWTHGTEDIVVADGSVWEMGTLGQMGLIPGWPGDDTYPPQPMVSQIKAVLDDYSARGGTVHIEMMEGSAHGPHIDNFDRWTELFFGFIS